MAGETTVHPQGDAREKIGIWISFSLLGFFGLGCLTDWDDFYRAFFFLGAAPLSLYLLAVKREFPVGLLSPAVLVFLVLLLWLPLTDLFPGGADDAEVLRNLRRALVVMVFLCAVLFALEQWLRRPLLHARLLTGLVAVAALWSVISFSLQAPTAWHRISGPGLLKHSIEGASVLIALWAVAVLLYVQATGRRRADAVLLAGATLLLILFVFFSQSRGPMLSLLLFAGGMATVFLFSGARRRALWITAGATGLLLVLVLLVAGMAGTDIFAMLEMLAERPSFRLEIWQAVLEHPPASIVHGSGISANFTASAAGQVASGLSGLPIEHPHNLLLGLYFSGGLIAAALALCALTAVAMQVLIAALPRACRAQLLLLMLLVIALNFTDSYRLIAPPNADWLFFWVPLLFAVALSARRDVQRVPVEMR